MRSLSRRSGALSQQQFVGWASPTFRSCIVDERRKVGSAQPTAVRQPRAISSPASADTKHLRAPSSSRHAESKAPRPRRRIVSDPPGYDHRHPRIVLRPTRIQTGQPCICTRRRRGWSPRPGIRNLPSGSTRRSAGFSRATRGISRTVTQEFCALQGIPFSRKRRP